MPKLQPRMMKRAPIVKEERTFTDPLQPGAELTVAMVARAEFSQILRITTLTEEFVEMYGSEDSVPLQVDGEDIAITPRLCTVIATIMALEQPQTDGTRYQFEDWAAFSAVMPTALSEIVVWTRDLIKEASAGPDVVGKDTPVPNEFAAPTGATSEPPQNTDSPIIPKSSPEETQSLLAPTDVSVSSSQKTRDHQTSKT